MKARYSRVQSPSSINTYKQCPRKYYYQYIEKIPTGTNIHLIRGGIAHKVLEKFFSIKLSEEDDLVGDKLIKWINSLFEEEWNSRKEEMDSLGLDENKIAYFYEETKNMLNMWAHSFLERLNGISRNPKEAFNILKPRMEMLYRSDELGVRGFIDVIEEIDGNVRLIDYKTSNKSVITDDYRLQLAIYALLYKEKHDVLPDKVGINFLKFAREIEIPVTEELLKLAEFEIELIHMNTQFTGKENYPKKVSPLCKWSTGQCDFYEICINSKNL